MTTATGPASLCWRSLSVKAALAGLSLAPPITGRGPCTNENVRSPRFTADSKPVSRLKRTSRSPEVTTSSPPDCLISAVLPLPVGEGWGEGVLAESKHPHLATASRPWRPALSPEGEGFESAHTHVHSSRPSGSSTRTASASAGASVAGSRSRTVLVPPGGMDGTSSVPDGVSTLYPAPDSSGRGNRRSSQVNLHWLASVKL